MIDNEQEYAENQKSLCELKNNLLEISRYCRGEHWLNNSEMQNWLDKVEFIYNHPEMRDKISDFSPEELSAYHVLQKLTPELPIESEKSEYNFFSGLLEILTMHSWDKKILLEEYLENEDSGTVEERLELQTKLQEDYDNLDQQLHKKLQEYCFAQEIEFTIEENLLEQIKQLHHTYPAVKGLIRSIEGWDRDLPLTKEEPLKETDLCFVTKNDKNENWREAFKDSIQHRSKAFVLEHIANIEKKYAKSRGHDITLSYLEQNLPLELLQNRIVTAGLYFGEKGHPFFGFGSMFMVSQILETSLEDILAWSIVSRIAQKLHQSVLAEDNSIESKHTDVIYQDLTVIRNIIRKHQSKLLDRDLNDFIAEFFVECSVYLKAISVKRGFDGIDLYKWMLDIHDLITLYHSCQRQFEYRSTPEYLRKGKCTKKKKVLVLGDSSSAGVGTKDEDKCKRWTTVLEKDLTKAFGSFGLEPMVINCSVAGYGTKEGEEALPGILRCFPDASILVTIQIGNDGLMRREMSDVKKAVCAMVKLVENHIPSCDFIWGAGLPDTLPVENKFRDELKTCMKEVVEETRAKGVLLPSELLTADKMSYDNVHFGIEVQEDIAKFASKAVQSVMLSQLRKKEGSQCEPDTASHLSLTPYYNAKSKSIGAGISSLQDHKHKPAGAGSKC